MLTIIPMKALTESTNPYLNELLDLKDQMIKYQENLSRVSIWHEKLNEQAM